MSVEYDSKCTEHDDLIPVFIRKVKEKDPNPTHQWDKCLIDDLRIRIFKDEDMRVGFCYNDEGECWSFGADELRAMADVLDEIGKGEHKDGK